MDNFDVPLPSCPHCETHVQPGDRFCGACGKEINDQSLSSAEFHEDAFTVLRPTIFYYGITLLVLATYKLTPAFPEGFEGMLAITIVDTFIVVAFGIISFRELKPLLSLSKIKPLIVASTAGVAMIAAFVVSVVAELINISISDDVFYSTYLFEDTSHPFLFATLFIAVHPAIFEEIAFRGFIFNNVSELATPINAIYITGFVFGIIHLAIISMLWLVPIGVVFAWLRWKYNTLWYGVVGHFVYNFCITVLEYNGWTLMN